MGFLETIMPVHAGATAIKTILTTTTTAITDTSIDSVTLLTGIPFFLLQLWPLSKHSTDVQG
jgi:hypothetical protein